MNLIGYHRSSLPYLLQIYAQNKIPNPFIWQIENAHHCLIINFNLFVPGGSWSCEANGLSGRIFANVKGPRSKNGGGGIKTGNHQDLEMQPSTHMHAQRCEVQHSASRGVGER